MTDKDSTKYTETGPGRKGGQSWTPEWLKVRGEGGATGSAKTGTVAEVHVSVRIDGHRSPCDAHVSRVDLSLRCSSSMSLVRTRARSHTHRRDMCDHVAMTCSVIARLFRWNAVTSRACARACLVSCAEGGALHEPPAQSISRLSPSHPCTHVHGSPLPIAVRQLVLRRDQGEARCRPPRYAVGRVPLRGCRLQALRGEVRRRPERLFRRLRQGAQGARRARSQVGGRGEARLKRGCLASAAPHMVPQGRGYGGSRKWGRLEGRVGGRPLS